MAIEDNKPFDLLVVTAHGSTIHPNVTNFVADHLGGLVIYGELNRRIAAYAPGGWLYCHEPLDNNYAPAEVPHEAD